MHTKVQDTEITVIAYKTNATFDDCEVAVEVRNEQLSDTDAFQTLTVHEQESNSRYWKLVCDCPAPGRYDFRLLRIAGYDYDTEEVIYQSKLRILSNEHL
jgi:hypothetical protein